MLYMIYSSKLLCNYNIDIVLLRIDVAFSRFNLAIFSYPTNSHNEYY